MRFVKYSADSRKQRTSREATDAEHSAVNAAIQAVGWPSAAIMSYLSSRADFVGMRVADMALSIAVAAMTTLLLSIIVGVGIGSLAHVMFWRRIRLSPVYAAIALGLIFDFVLWGWLFVLSAKFSW